MEVEEGNREQSVLYRGIYVDNEVILGIYRDKS